MVIQLPPYVSVGVKNMANTKFSVVTICYENLPGVIKTSQSVLEQTFKQYEWIIIDGNSKDGTVNFINAQQSSSLKFVSEQDNGIFDAMNKGLALANGEYVIFMNSGDTFADKETLQKINDFMGDRQPDLIYGGAKEFDGHNHFNKPAREPAANRFVMFTHHQSILYKTSLCKQVGYDTSYKLSADWVMTTRFIKSSQNISFLSVPISVSIFERGGVSQQKKHRVTMNRELFRIYREEQGFNYLYAAALWTAKVGINKARELLPSVYDKLRYAKNEDQSQ